MRINLGIFIVILVIGIVLLFVGIFSGNFALLSIAMPLIMIGAYGTFIRAVTRYNARMTIGEQAIEDKSKRLAEEEKMRREDAIKRSNPTDLFDKDPKRYEGSADAKRDAETTCPHCGKFLGYGDRDFCPHCGNRINDRML